MNRTFLFPTLVVLNVWLGRPAPVTAAPVELKGSPEELSQHLAALPQIVTLLGEGEAKAPADKADVTLKVTTEDKSLTTALRQNLDLRSRLAAALKEAGLGADQVQAARFAASQKHGLFTEKAKSHRIDHFVKVTVRDEKEFQAVGGAVDRWAEVQLVGVEVAHSAKEALKAKARAQALEKAAEARQYYEEKLGVKLVVKRFSEVAIDPAPADRRAAYYSLAYSGAGSGLDKMAVPGRAGADASAAVDDTGLAFGDLTFKAQVKVDYIVLLR